MLYHGTMMAFEHVPSSRSLRARRRRTRRGAGMAGVLLGSTILYPLVSLAVGVSADTPSLAPAAIRQEKESVLFSSNDLDYDSNTEIITASGRVEITQGEDTLLADRVTYDKKRDLVTAQGNVSMMGGDGNVFFADQVNLTGDMKQGAVQGIKARLADNSLFAAQSGEKVNEFVTKLKNAVYSPCFVRCEDGTPKTPLWQVTADDVTIDETDQKITYHDATMDVFGVPILYTPYLSHPTPGADNKSGFLTPEYGHNRNLGTTLKIPYYYTIAPDRDVTITPYYTTTEGLVMVGEYRQRMNTGRMLLQGSITQADDRDPLGNPSAGNRIRGHIFGDGDFKLSDRWNTGFKIQRTTDDTYLRLYRFSNDTLLTSRAYVEGLNFVDHTDRTYAQVQGLAFQGLRQEDDNERSPFVVPLAEFYYQSDPLWHGARASFAANAMALTRNLGVDSRRLSLDSGINLPYTTAGGHVLETGVNLRGDLYYVANVPQSGGQTFDGSTGRLRPEWYTSWRYPLIRRLDRGALIVEPIASLAVAPGGGNPEEIPNEDSQYIEFAEYNLFSNNRYAGLDKVEEGTRLTYGLRGHWQQAARSVRVMAGQLYSWSEATSLAFNRSRSDHASDYISSIEAEAAPVAFTYRNQLDQDNLSPIVQEFSGGLYFPRFSLATSYVALSSKSVLGRRHQISPNAMVKLDDFWTLNLQSERNLDTDQFISNRATLTFQNECLILLGSVGKDYFSDRDIRPATSFFLRVSFKNLD